MACQALANCAIHHLAHPSYVELESLCRHPGGSPQALSETKRSTLSDPRKTPVMNWPAVSGTAFVLAMEACAGTTTGTVTQEEAQAAFPAAALDAKVASRIAHMLQINCSTGRIENECPASLAFDRFPFSNVESCALNLASDVYRS